MKSIHYLLFLVLPFFYISVSFAESTPRNKDFYDVSEFDIVGVKLGMNLTEAKAAIVTNFEVTESDITPDKFPTKNLVLKKEIPLIYKAKKDQAEIVVHFSPAIPLDSENPLRVSMVIYKLPQSTDNYVAIKELAIEKYGNPTNGYDPSQDYLDLKWCNAEEKDKRVGCQNHIGAIMETSNSFDAQIKMHDLMKYDKAIMKYLEDQKKQKPSF